MEKEKEKVSLNEKKKESGEWFGVQIKKKKKMVISGDLVAFTRESLSSLQWLRSRDVSMMIPLYRKPSTCRHSKD